jgi:hypothetical protein
VNAATPEKMSDLVGERKAANGEDAGGRISPPPTKPTPARTAGAVVEAGLARHRLARYGPRMYRRLQAAPMLETITRLRHLIDDRFPGSGLSKLAAELEVVGREAMNQAEWIGRPHVPLRIGIGLLALPIVLTAALAIASLPVHSRLESLAEFLQALESGINDVVSIGIAIFFLVRYLDYCGAMLCLIGKVAAWYVERFDDALVLGAVDDIESLTNEFSRKIWQKISIVQADARFGQP